IWDLGKAYFILNEYDRIYGVDKDELEVIKALMTFPQDFWQIGLQYYVEKQPWAMEYFLMRLGRIVSDREIRNRFLREFLTL
ncbi:MAG TPA: CotS family spore coat protein, partial [Negativicutes bacterium]|nr:CotS family spore coat protein [Negativicutes bacterium]